MNRLKRIALAVWVGLFGFSAAPAAEKPLPAVPLEIAYRGYAVNFMQGTAGDLIKFSDQKTFFNTSFVHEDKQVSSKLKAAAKALGEQDYRRAIKIYHELITRYPDALIRISDAGIYASASMYAQQRLLNMPPEALAKYRVRHDPKAREVYESARKRYSVAGLHEVVQYHMASSFGARAFFDLGSRALDLGYYEQAAEYFERIKDWFPADDMDAGLVMLRLALAFRKLGQKEKLAALQKEFEALNREKTALKPEAWAQVLKIQRDPIGLSHQRRRLSDYLSFRDDQLFESMPAPLSSESAIWNAELPMEKTVVAAANHSGGELLPFHYPWVVGNSLYYLHYNRVYCRSLVTGKLRWSTRFSETDRNVRRLVAEVYMRPTVPVWYSSQDLLVDEDLVYANMRVNSFRESLVALDRATGELRWSAGAMRPQREEDLRVRYDAAPTLGPLAVYAAWTQDESYGADQSSLVAGISAFDKQTGQILWRKELCRLFPTGKLQDQHGIMVFSSSPLYHQGKIYHVTNAGVVSALNAASGQVEWSMRYPHFWQRSQRGYVDAHADIPFGSKGSSRGGMHGPVFSNRPPLLVKNRLYVAPVDSRNFLCLDKNSGKLIWDAVPNADFTGFNSKNEMVFAGGYYGGGHRALDLYDPLSGKKLWSFSPTYRVTWEPKEAYDARMQILERPTLTRDGKVYFSSRAVPRTSSIMHNNISNNTTYGEWCLDLNARSVVKHKVFFPNYYRYMQEGRIRQQIKNAKNYKAYEPLVPPQNINARLPFDPTKRMPFQLHGIHYELCSTGDKLWGNCDLAALGRMVSAEQSAEAQFALAEIRLQQGAEREAISLFESCRLKLRPEARVFQRLLDRELYRLYKKQAWEALLGNDLQRFHQNVARMPKTATTALESTIALLAQAESFEKQGKIMRAAASLQIIIRYFAATDLSVSMSYLKNKTDNEGLLRDTIGTAFRKQPADLQALLKPASALAQHSVNAYFHAIAPLQDDVVVNAEQLATDKLIALLARNPASMDAFEALARETLGKEGFEEKMYRVRRYPKTKAAQAVLAECLDNLKQLPEKPVEKALWILSDLSSRLKLEMPQDFSKRAALSPAAVLAVPFPETAETRTLTLEKGTENLRMPLVNRGDPLQGRVFLGGRAKKRLGYKFSLACRDLSTGKALWQVPDIRLKGGGDEPGFKEVFVIGPLVVTYGKNDILAYRIEGGTLAWRYSVPFDFELKSIDRAGKLLVLSGERHSQALLTRTGEPIWTASEKGYLYGRPILRADLLISVRSEPYGVTFRRLGTGHLLRRLKLPTLTNERRHPVVSADFSRGVLKARVDNKRLPMGVGEELLVLSDNYNYLAVDLKKMALRWKRPIEGQAIGGSPPLRLFVRKPYLVVLKRDFKNPALHCFDSRSGKRLWKKEEGALYGLCFAADGKSIYGLNLPKTGDNTVQLTALEAGSGKVIAGGYRLNPAAEARPDVDLIHSYANNRVVLRVIDGEDLALQVADPGTGKVVHGIRLEGPGSEFAVHGGKSWLVQGRSLILMDSKKIVVGTGR